jgi:hypothetical protein
MGASSVGGLQRAIQARSGSAVTTTPVPERQLRMVGEGRSLEPGVRRTMEQFFGADFSGVRVHVGSAAQAMGALAFTLGEEIHFAPGLYNPSSREGIALLGHELTHVVQQRAGRVANPYGKGVALVQDPNLEAQADQIGQELADLMRARVSTPTTVTTAMTTTSRSWPEAGVAYLQRSVSVAQPFWLEESGTTRWESNQAFSSKKFRPTGKKQWKYPWLPAWFNSELPVYERAPKPAKVKAKPKKVPVEQAFEMTFEDWIYSVQDELIEWVEKRGGMVREPEEWEYKELWRTHPPGASGEWDGWQALRMFYQRASGLEKIVPVYLPKTSRRQTHVKAARPDREVAAEYVAIILGRIRGAIGKCAVWDKKGNLARQGCVKYGPSYPVPSQYADLIYHEFCGMEGDAFEGGRLHIVNKSGSRQYNITLHQDYLAGNPKTMVNMHIMAE